MAILIARSLICQGCTVSVASMNPDKLANEFNDIRFFSSGKKNILGIIREVASADKVLIGGGTLIQNDFNAKLSPILIYICVVAVAARLLRKEVLFVSVGINELSWKNKLISRLLGKISGRVRDSVSVENARKNGIRVSGLSVCPDIGFLCSSGLIKLPSDISCNGYGVISLVGEKLDAGAMSALLDAAIEGLLKKKVSKIYLLCMDLRKSEEYALYQRFQDESGVEIFIENSLASTLSLIAGAKFCVAMRLHAAIISTSYSVPTVVVAREDKQRFLREIVGKDRYLEFGRADLGRALRLAIEGLNEGGCPQGLVDSYIDRAKISYGQLFANYG